MTTSEFRLNLIQAVYISKASLFYFTSIISLIGCVPGGAR